MLNKLFDDWDKFFNKMSYPSWVDQSKIKRKVKEENGGITVIESYSDGTNHWQSSSWTYGSADNREMLDKQLKFAIESESFEEAAVIRDKLKQLK